MTSVSERPQRTVLRGSRLFDGDHFWEQPDPFVVIDGATITAVGAGQPPSGADIVELPGATLLPGLIDTHVHLAFDASPNPVASLAERDDGEAFEAMAQAGRVALAGGVTTVRDLGDRNYLSLGLHGRPDMPAIVSAGPPITTERGHCHFLGGSVPDDASAVRAAVRERAERGCGVIKVMSSGGTMTPGTRQEVAQFQREVLAAAVDEAHRLGLPVTAHAHGTPAIVNAIAAGVDGMEHVSFWTADGVDDRPDVMQQIADAGIVVGATAGQLPPPPGLTPPPAVLARIPKIIANTRRMHEFGAVVVAGTDAGIAPTKPHDILRTALWQLAQIGIGPLDALRAATTVAAGVLGLQATKGRLAAGYDADVLIVDGDPLAEPDAIHRIRAVYARGVCQRRARSTGARRPPR